MDVVGLLAIRGTLPLVKTIRKDQAATVLEGFTEGGLFGNSLAPSIDHSITDTRVICPCRNQTPPQHLEFPLFIFSNYRSYLLGRSYVIAGGYGRGVLVDAKLLN